MMGLYGHAKRPHCCHKKFVKRSGQGILEYVLLMALLSSLTFAFVKVVGQKVFGEGLKRLPAKVAVCLSHTDQVSTTCQ